MAANENAVCLVETLKKFPSKSINTYSDLMDATKGGSTIISVSDSNLFLSKTDGFIEAMSIPSYIYTEKGELLPQHKLTGYKVHVNIKTNVKAGFPEMDDAFAIVFAMAKKFSELIVSVKITNMFEIWATHMRNIKALEIAPESRRKQLENACESTDRLLKGCQFTFYIYDNADAKAYALFFNQLQLAFLSAGIEPAQILPSGDEALSDYISGRWDGVVGIEIDLSAYIAATDSPEYIKEKHSECDLFSQIKEFPPLEQKKENYLCKIQTLASRVGFWQQQTVTGLFGPPEIIEAINRQTADEGIKAEQKLKDISLLAQQKKACLTRKAPTQQLIEALKNADESAIDTLLQMSVASNC